MRDLGGEGPTYAVVTEELQQAAAAVEAVTEAARRAVVESLPSTATSLGDGGLTRTLTDFCARWDTGLSHLVGDSEEMSRRLRTTAAVYLRAEQGAIEAYERAVHQPTGQRATAWWDPPATAVLLRPHG